MNLPKNRLFWSVAAGHATNDLFMAMGPVVLTAISGVYLDLSPALIGVAVSAQQLAGAASQPLFGWLSDKGNSRLLGAGGVLWTVSGLMLAFGSAMLGSLVGTITFFALAALGSGAFHPVGTAQAAAEAREAAAGHTAMFFLFGQLGLALGPLLAGVLWGLTQGADGSGGSLLPFFVLGAAALPSVIFMRFTLPTRTHANPVHQAEDAAAKKKKRADTSDTPVRALMMLGLLVLLRGIAYPGSVAFIPVLFRAKGWSPEAYGGITSAFWLASAAAGVYFGGLADRIDRRYVVTVPLLLAVPTYFALPLVDGPLAFVLVLAAGALVGGCHSILVVLAQDLIPGGKAFASGVALGFIFGVGALGTLSLGYMADGFNLGAVVFDGVGLVRAFQLISGFVLASALLGMALPPQKPPAVLEPEPASTAAQGAD